MNNEKTSKTIASIIGPILIVLAITEYINFDIWHQNWPALTYLNGLFLLTVGLTIVRLNFTWKGWQAVLSLAGAVLTFAGILRMVFPKSAVLEESIITYTIFAIMLILGMFLSFKGYSNSTHHA